MSCLASAAQQIAQPEGVDGNLQQLRDRNEARNLGRQLGVDFRVDDARQPLAKLARNLLANHFTDFAPELAVGNVADESSILDVHVHVADAGGTADHANDWAPIRARVNGDSHPDANLVGVHLDDAEQCDWDQDVDLTAQIAGHSNVQILDIDDNLVWRCRIDGDPLRASVPGHVQIVDIDAAVDLRNALAYEIGRASCRERVSQLV